MMRWWTIFEAAQWASLSFKPDILWNYQLWFIIQALERSFSMRPFLPFISLPACQDHDPSSRRETILRMEKLEKSGMMKCNVQTLRGFHLFCYMVLLSLKYIICLCVYVVCPFSSFLFCSHIWNMRPGQCFPVSVLIRENSNKKKQIKPLSQKKTSQVFKLRDSLSSTPKAAFSYIISTWVFFETKMFDKLKISSFGSPGFFRQAAISTRSWFKVFSRSSLPPPPKLPFPRRRPTASISSMKTMEGAWERACAISGSDAPAGHGPPSLVLRCRQLC